MAGPLIIEVDISRPQNAVEAATIAIAHVAQHLHEAGEDPDTIVHALLNTIIAVGANTDMPVEGIQENLRRFADNMPAALDQVSAQLRRRAN